MNPSPSRTNNERLVHVPTGSVTLEGNLVVPAGACCVVLFAHGSGSSRHSPRNRFVADALHQKALATLLIDLLSPEEEEVDEHTAHLRFDIALLAERLVAAIDWLKAQPQTGDLAVGCFGASTGAAAALVAAAARPQTVGSVVSRGGRPDLAGRTLKSVRAATLLIVGGADVPVIGMNQEALGLLGCAEKKLVIIPGASHLFPEPGALEQVARLAGDWFVSHLA
jgi:dienelactone hydrolase